MLARVVTPLLALLVLLPVGRPAAQTPDSVAATPLRTQAPAPRRPAAEMRNAGRRYAGAVRGCYEREGLRQDPALRGTVELTLVVHAGGEVRAVAVDTLATAGVGMADVARCVATEATEWHFAPAPIAADTAVLTYELLPPGAPAPPTP